MPADTRLGELRKKKRAEMPSLSKRMEMAGQIEPGETKLGPGEHNMAVGPQRLNIRGPGQTITGDSKSTRIAAGKELTLSVDKPTGVRLELDGTAYAMHPQIHQRASSAAFPLQVFIPTVSRDMIELAKLAKTVRAVLALLR